MAELFVRGCQDNREKGRFLLHELVLMPDHFHLIITPAYEIPLEKAVQYLKGGYSFRVKKELGWAGEIWSSGFSEHRIKDAEDYENHRNYILRNPVKASLVEFPEKYEYSSGSGCFEVDAAPPALKRGSLVSPLSPG